MEEPPRPRGGHLRNDGWLIVNGDLIFGDQFTTHVGGDGAGPESGGGTTPRNGPILPVRIPAGETAGTGGARDWRGGADLEFGGESYLLHDLHLGERPSRDGSAVHREACALRRAPGPGPATARRPRRGRDRRPREGPRYAWLRQVAVREDTPAARRALAALSGERDLLTGLGGVQGVPELLRHDGSPDGRTATLIVTWPVSKFAGRPCQSLDTVVEPGEDPGAFALARLFGGLAGLCATLAHLHGRGLAHRALTRPGVIVLDGGRLVLRDLGLAARGPEPGEGPPDYQAPEQRRRQSAPPGPPTDAYRLAALVHHLLTGRLPALPAPPPLGRLVPGLPERLGLVLDGALAPDPARRPDARTLGAAFRAARDDLSRGTYDVSSSPPPRPPHPRPR
ncbi:hypothetical protein AGRA3207_001008 [Actinomadura graeca]|uniref:non-specific serine/threonine protein kinase n=1 Tax=Actinomadura graeca TaxID=2750812 RepID=A0ABX8QRD1_9ACTN|nr:hypothetical protein [Actinomadura graeca]QXJ20317.1 hypothetical protein AGRA3207_001008 [Actinomadura graeca]